VAYSTGGALADVFVRDRHTAMTTQVSVSTSGRKGNGHSQGPSISANGRFVAYWSLASNLLPPGSDTNDDEDVFVHDRQTGQTTRVSVSSAGAQGDDGSQFPSITANGRFVAFTSSARALVPNDTNGQSDVFVHDRQTRRTARVSVSCFGVEGNARSGSGGPSISADGRYVAFTSDASNLVDGDTNDASEVFTAANPLAGPMPPWVTWAGETGWENDGVHPDVGKASTTSFVFKVKVHDLDGNVPKYVRLVLYRDGTKWQTVNLTPGTEPLVGGRTYYTQRKLPAGNYDYRFAAGDVDGAATGPPTEMHTGPIMGAPPFLTFVPEPGYRTDGVKPNSGQAGVTTFRFKVVYRAYDEDPPKRVRVRLWRNSAAYAIVRMQPIDPAASPLQGIVYAVARTLPAGTYEYQFEAADYHGAAGGPASLRMPGPKVQEAGSAFVAGLSALSTGNGGVEVTFTLTAPASVSAHVINAAGRVVAVITSHSWLRPGTQSLAWSGRTTAGLRAPDGTYLVRVEARAADGCTANSVAPCRLLR